jgi:hypothetical protein
MAEIIKTKRLSAISLSLMLVIILAACAAQPVQTVEVTRIVKETVLVTQVVIITATPPPPTPTPEATPTPAFARWTIEQAAAAIIAAGLEFESPRPMTADDYGFAPYVGEGVRFLIPSLGPDSGGRLFALQNQAELDSLREYYESLGRQSAAFFSWVFTRDNILIQINGSLPADIAARYEQALKAME